LNQERITGGCQCGAVRYALHAAPTTLVPELDEFAAAIKENRLPTVTVADSRLVLRVLDAVMKSGRSHQPVMLATRS
jgi:predicted dehydrogenase